MIDRNDHRDLALARYRRRIGSTPGRHPRGGQRGESLVVRHRAPLLYLAVLGSVTRSLVRARVGLPRAAASETRLGVAATLAYLEEVRAIARHGRHMAFFRLLPPDPPPAPARSPVLLVHGVLCNRGSMEDLRRELGRRGIHPLYTMSYGPPLASIERFVDQLAVKIDAILAATGATRVAPRRPQHGRARGARVPASPWPGQGQRRDHARHAAARQRSCVALSRDVAHAAPPRQRVAFRAQSARGRAPGVRMVSLWSWHDSMVAPQTSAKLDGAANIVVHGIGHNALVSSPRVAGLVAEELQRVAAAPVKTPATSESPG
jgi:hypothetical protein